MLKTRVLTALVIFPVTLVVVFLFPPLVFKGAIAILFLGACHEFARITGQTSGSSRALMILQALLFAGLLLAWQKVTAYVIPALAVFCLAWLVLFIKLPLYQAGAQPDAAFRKSGFAGALVALTSCWLALSWLHGLPDGPMVVFLLLLIIWASDTGAYFSGKQFGRRKLAPVISPKKTWEGVYGGMALALLAAWLWAGPVAQLGMPLPSLAGLTAITVLASIGGDLFISLHKRTVGLDDAGNLFPGHGGVLDRYDSLLPGAVFFTLIFGLVAR